MNETLASKQQTTEKSAKLGASKAEDVALKVSEARNDSEGRQIVLQMVLVLTTVKWMRSNFAVRRRKPLSWRLQISWSFPRKSYSGSNTVFTCT
jgi:hypothetical protein